MGVIIIRIFSDTYIRVIRVALHIRIIRVEVYYNYKDY